MKNLLITTIGKKHHADVWRSGGLTYDVITIDYTRKQVFKYPGIYEAITMDRLWDYVHYWMPDEDILLEPDKIDEFFALMEENNLDLAQPSVLKSDDSFPSWDRFIHVEGEDIIPTDFVEIMCPAFSNRALRECIESFPLSLSGWGLDLAWAKILMDAGMKLAIVNSIVVKHTRPVGAGELYGILKSHNTSPSREMKKIKEAYGVTEASILNKHDNSTLSNHPR